MHIYRRGKSFWCQLFYPATQRRRWRAGTSMRTAQLVVRHLTSLIEAARGGVAIDEATATWVKGLTPEQADRLRAWSLIGESELVMGQSLAEQLQRWHDGLVNRGRPPDYAEARRFRADALLTAAGARDFRTIEAERVQAALADLRRDGTLSDRTIAHRISAAKAFTRWMHRMGYAPRDPLAILPVTRGQPKRQRRALTEVEQKALITTVNDLGTRLGLPGPERALLYRTALGTGLRLGALTRLTVGDVDTTGWLMANGTGAANKKSSAKPLAPDLLADLIKHCQGKLPSVPLFALADVGHAAECIRKDCTAAGVSTTGVDFHSLRHTFGTTLARAGVHPRTLMALMDHGTIQITMALYAHSMPEDERAAVDKLPNLEPTKGAEAAG